MASQRFLSSKRLQIDKANTAVVIILSVASFITVFSLVASKALLSQRAYQTRVIEDKRKALKQLKSNNDAATKLVGSYKVFVGTPENVIGGSSAGNGDRDGDNGRIVLDALPSKYDYPALATSLTKILSGKGFRLTSVAGTDDELNQSLAANATSTKPIEIPFQLSVSGDSKSIIDFVSILQRTIRPIKVGQLSLTGTDKELTVSVTAKTYYQPQKIINITTKVVK